MPTSEKIAILHSTPLSGTREQNDRRALVYQTYGLDLLPVRTHELAEMTIYLILKIRNYRSEYD